jgi:vancomycin aglycone glucosyltransferase
MRVVLSTYGSRGEVEPPAGLTAAVRAPGAEVRVCAPPDEAAARRPADTGAPPAARRRRHPAYARDLRSELTP